MSSRALRRLQEGKAGVQGLPCSEPLDGEDEPVHPAPIAAGARSKISAPHLNPFDLVNLFDILENQEELWPEAPGFIQSLLSKGTRAK